MEQFITGEKVKIDYEIAGVGLRIGAYFIDFAFQMAAFYALYMVIWVSMMGSISMSRLLTNETASTAILIILIVLLSLLGLFILFFRLFFELIWKGQTPGKKILKIRVIQDDGTYLRVMPAILRNLFRIIDGLPVYNMAGFITMLINKKHKRIGDIVAGTIVIKEHQIALPDKVKEIKLDCFSEISDFSSLFGDGAKDIFNSYFLTKKDLDPVPYGTVQNKIVELIELKTGVKRPYNVSKEDFIMAVYLKIK